MGIANYYMHKAFPDIVSPDLTFKALGYIYGCHPGSDYIFLVQAAMDLLKEKYFLFLL